MTKEYIRENYPGVRIRAGVVIRCGSRILFVREAKSGNYGPPKVLVDWTVDRSVADAAIRASREELGLEFDVLETSRVYIVYHKRHREMFVYYSVTIDNAPQLTPRKRNITKISWISIDDRLKYSRSTRELFAAMKSCCEC